MLPARETDVSPSHADFRGLAAAIEPADGHRPPRSSRAGTTVRPSLEILYGLEIGS
jgi:hypothetical protein